MNAAGDKLTRYRPDLVSVRYENGGVRVLIVTLPTGERLDIVIGPQAAPQIAAALAAENPTPDQEYPL